MVLCFHNDALQHRTIKGNNTYEELVKLDSSISSSDFSDKICFQHLDHFMCGESDKINVDNTNLHSDTRQRVEAVNLRKPYFN